MYNIHQALPPIKLATYSKLNFILKHNQPIFRLASKGQLLHCLSRTLSIDVCGFVNKMKSSLSRRVHTKTTTKKKLYRMGKKREQHSNSIHKKK